MKTTPFLLTGLLFLGLAGSVKGQAEHNHTDRCGHIPVLERLAEQDAASMAGIEAARQAVLAYLAQRDNSRVADEETIYIPTVVHVVYNTPAQNISVSQVLSQIDILNADFALLNTDFGNARADFRAVAGTANIQFCMAETDPEGAVTDGIVRVETAKTSFESGDAPSGWDNVKFDLNGGSDAWPRNDYLNIWVCNLAPSAGVLGYAYPPGVSGVLDGVVIAYRFFGNQGVVSPPYNQGRTSTHEIGHWLGLGHIWGDGGCGVDDGFSDTPQAGGPNFGCPSTSAASCTTPDMWENYMDYTDDRCMVMFTEEQTDAMRAVMATSRASVASSPKCYFNTAIEPTLPLEAIPFRVYPNPVMGEQIVWEAASPLTADGQLSLVDATGRVLRTASVAVGTQQQTWSIGSLPAGFYTLVLRSGNATQQQRFWVAR